MRVHCVHASPRFNDFTWTGIELRKEEQKRGGALLPLPPISVSLSKPLAPKLKTIYTNPSKIFNKTKKLLPQLILFYL